MTTEEINKQLDFLVSEGRIVFNEKTEELMIVNWLKYNSARSPKVAAVIDKELREIKTLEFESEVIKKCVEFGYPIKTKEPKKDTVSIAYGYGIDTVFQKQNTISQPEPSPEPEPSSSPEPTPEPTDPHEKNSAVGGVYSSSLDNPYHLYQSLFGVLTPIASDDISKWVDDIGVELVCEAMRKSALDSKGYRYATGIMRRWANGNIKTMDDVRAEEVAFQNRNQQKHKSTKAGESLRDWDQYKPRELDPEEKARLKRLMREQGVDIDATDGD